VSPTRDSPISVSPVERSRPVLTPCPEQMVLSVNNATTTGLLSVVHTSAEFGPRMLFDSATGLAGN
jgi:hypothetical protein